MLCALYYFLGNSKKTELLAEGGTPLISTRNCICSIAIVMLDSRKKKIFSWCFQTVHFFYTQTLVLVKKYAPTSFFLGGFKYFSVSSLFENMVQFDVRIFFKSG